MKTTLSQIPVGRFFTFPEGREDAGIWFKVLEQHGVRAKVEAQVEMSVLPVSVLSGDEIVIALD